METVRASAPEEVPLEEVPLVRGEAAIRERYAAYLADESRLCGRAEWLYFPEDTAQVAAVVRWAQRERVPLTVSGGRTGITGGAVPEGGALLSLERMDRVGPVRREGAGASIEVGPALTLERLAVLLGEGLGELPAGGFFYPPDPTEATAQVGGSIACDASGARSFRYGSTRRWVQALEVVLPTGEVLWLERGRERFDAGGRLALERGDGRVVLELPERPACRARKDVAGYACRPGMDLLDLFVGSEGTLGVVTRAVLRLAPAPAGRVSVMLFPEGEGTALEAVRRLREGEGGLEAESIEFFDGRSLDLLEEKRREGGPGGEIPPFPHPSGAAVFAEFPYHREEEVDGILEGVLALVEDLGVAEERTWVGTEPAEVERMRSFRHALPETVNSIIGRRQAQHPAVRKVGTDLAVPVEVLEDFLAFHRRLLEGSGLEYVIFGHFGDAHLHCNMLPRDEREMDRALDIYQALAEESVRLGGTVAAEHGIGRLKRGYLRLMLPEESLAGMKRLKTLLDPAGVLAPGVMF